MQLVRRGPPRLGEHLYLSMFICPLCFPLTCVHHTGVAAELQVSGRDADMTILSRPLHRSDGPDSGMDTVQARRVARRYLSSPSDSPSVPNSVRHRCYKPSRTCGNTHHGGAGASADGSNNVRRVPEICVKVVSTQLSVVLELIRSVADISTVGHDSVCRLL
jgi:hypothetical protein